MFPKDISLSLLFFIFLHSKCSILSILKCFVLSGSIHRHEVYFNCTTLENTPVFLSTSIKSLVLMLTLPEVS